MLSRLILIIVALGASLLPGWTQDTVYLHPIVKERKLGFIGSNGREVIQPKFDTRVDCYGYPEWPQFSEGLAAVAIGERLGYIDTAGKVRDRASVLQRGPISRWRRTSSR